MDAVPARALNLLLVEDSPRDEKLLLDELTAFGFQVQHQRVDQLHELERALAAGGMDLVISEFELPSMDAVGALNAVKASGRDLPFIVVSGTASDKAAVSVLRAGAHDWLPKENLARLGPAIERELRDAGVRAERRRMQEQLLVSDRMASMGMLAAGVAHEINNPLAAVMANLDLAREAASRLVGERPAITPADAQELLEIIIDAHAAAERVRNIVRDVSTFSRPADARVVPVDVQRVLESTIRMAGHDLRHRARIVKSYRPVPAVMVSEAQLGQVFLNVLVNALDSMAPGRADHNELRVSIAADGPGSVVVEMSDTGSGMTPQVLDQIFTPFFTTKAPGVGTGLGLVICRRILSGMGGEITASSTPGQGSTFRIRLPATREPALPAMRMTATESPAFHIPRRGRILVVDDESIVTQVIRRVLGRDHDVAVSFSGRQALERLRAGERYDLILCDMQMPEMTGMQLYAELSSLAPGQAEQMMFMSGGPMHAEAMRFMDERPERCIDKPFEAMTLVAAAAQWIR